MRSFLLLLLLFSHLFSIGQSTDTDTTNTSSFSINASIINYNHHNGGEFYNGSNFSLKDTYYEKIEMSHMASISIGVQYKAIFQAVDLSYHKGPGVYSGDFGEDSFENTYVGYVIGYEFLKKNKWWLKPIVLLDLAYTKKSYTFHSSSEYGGGNLDSRIFKDNSDLYLVQLPIGIKFNYNIFFAMVEYHIKLYSHINGSYTDDSYSYRVNIGSTSTSSSGSYSGNINESIYKSINSIISIRLGFSINL